MVSQVGGSHTVDCINWATLKPVNVARYNLCALLRVGYEQSDLVLVRKLSQILKGTMSYSEETILSISGAKFSNNSIEIENEKILVSHPSSSFKKQSC